MWYNDVVMTEDEREHCLLRYESLRNKALDMAWTLRRIDRELRNAAQCEGDYSGGYPSERLLPQLCKIMYASQGFHEDEELLSAAMRSGMRQDREMPPQHENN